MEQQANAACVEHERLPLCTRSARDVAGLGARFLDDRLGHSTALVRDVLGRLLGGDERLAKQVLEILVPYQLAFELLDAVGEVGPLPPHDLVAVGDVVEQGVDCGAVVAEHPALERNVPELDR